MTTNEVRTDVLAFFTDNFELIPTNPTLGLDPLPEISYDNKARPTEDETKSWLRVTLRPATGIQETLGRVGNRRFERIGFLFVQIFTPLDKGMQASDYLSDNIIDFIEGGETVGKIPFQNVSPPNDIGNEDTWNQVNISAEFMYHNLK